MQEQEQERAKKGNREFGFSFSILPPIGGCGPTFPRVATAVERSVSVLDLEKRNGMMTTATTMKKMNN